MAQSGEPQDKTDLRQSFLERRAVLHGGSTAGAAGSEIAAGARSATELANAELSERAIEFVNSNSAKSVAIYLSFSTEPSTKQIIAELLASGVLVLLPAVATDHSLRWFEFDGASTKMGALGFAEPDADRLPEASLTEADIIFVPALAVDENGARLGRGGGYYDRALGQLILGEKKHCLKVALVYDEEVLPLLPSETHDIAVDAVITDKRLIEF